MRHPLLYEINTRCWLAELSEDAGKHLTLAEVPDFQFEFWQRCGFTHVWLMGVWALGRRGREHSRQAFAGREEEFRCREVVGSPYAITGYHVSHKLGGEAALAEFRRKLNARGIQLILDFIPNHTAIDHPWAEAHPEFYVTCDKERAGTVKPIRRASRWFAHGHCGWGEPWVDTLQLDYRNPALRSAMIEELLSVAARCDGVRCDMAMLVLNEIFARTWREFPNEHGTITTEFWREAIGSLRRKEHGFLFLAEVYWDLEARLQELGFDYTYDKRLYDRLVARDGTGAVRYLRSLSPEFLNRSAHFIENHDEPRIASLLCFEEHRAAALLILALPGMRLLHEGQLTGRRIHSNVHFMRRGAEAPDESIDLFYNQILEELQTTAIGRGHWHLIQLHAANRPALNEENVLAIVWQLRPDAFDVVAVNLSAMRRECSVPLSTREIAGTWQLTDLLSGAIRSYSGAELAQYGLQLDLAPHLAQLFHCERIQ